MKDKLSQTFLTQTFPGLPSLCGSRLNTDNSPIVIKRGEKGYYRWEALGHLGENTTPEELNERFGVTPAQRQAMEIGSLVGWDVPGANPANYDETGTIRL